MGWPPFHGGNGLASVGQTPAVATQFSGRSVVPPPRMCVDNVVRVLGTPYKMALHDPCSPETSVGVSDGIGDQVGWRPVTSFVGVC